MSTEGAGRHRSSTGRGMLLLAVANIRREKLRSTLILVTVALATLMFITALGALGGLRGPIDAMMVRSNASHLVMDIDSRAYNPASIVSWWREKESVESVTPLLATITTDAHPVHDGRLLSEFFKLTERPRRAMEQDLLEFTEGESQSCPAPGEIWLPTSLARASGLHVGDTVEIPTDQGARPYTVSGVVVDPQYSSGFSNPVRVWIGPGELAGLFSAVRLHDFTFGVRLDDPAGVAALWAEFDAGFSGGYSGSSTPFNEMVDSYATFIRMLSILVLAFGVLSLLVALFIISSTISGEILANYRTFGVLKSMGYTPRNVVGIFQMQFLVLSLFAIPVGIVGGYFAARTLIGLMLQTIGTVHTELDFLGTAVITFVLLIGLVSLTAGVAGARAGRIKAASSIRFGAPEEALKMRIPIHLSAARYLPLSLVIGLKQAVSGKKRELYDLITVTATAFVLLFSVNVYYSMTMVGRNLPFWGFDASDVAVKVGDTSFNMRYETIKTHFRSEPDVLTLGGTSITATVVIPARDGSAARQLSGHVVDGDLDALGFLNLRGRHPERAGEVSLGITTAEDYGVGIGDSIDLTVLGQTLTFEVTGRAPIGSASFTRSRHSWARRSIWNRPRSSSRHRWASSCRRSAWWWRFCRWSFSWCRRSASSTPPPWGSTRRNDSWASSRPSATPRARSG